MEIFNFLETTQQTIRICRKWKEHVFEAFDDGLELSFPSISCCYTKPTEVNFFMKVLVLSRKLFLLRKLLLNP